MDKTAVVCFPPHVICPCVFLVVLFSPSVVLSLCSCVCFRQPCVVKGMMLRTQLYILLTAHVCT